MNLSNRPEIYIKGGVLLLLGILFLSSVFVLINLRYGLNNLFFEEESISADSILVVSQNTEWDYMDEGFEPGVGNIWTTSGYDSQFWKKGKGGFSADSSIGSSDNSQIVSLISQTKQGENVPSYFFRTTFTVNDAEKINLIKGKIHYNDAVLVYLNGNIIFAGNVPEGGYKSNQETGVAEHVDGVQYMKFEVTDTSSLVEGENILSVEIHEDNPDSTDAFFLLESMLLEQKKLNEPDIDVSSLILAPGEAEGNVKINWLTESDDFYKVEYMEASKYDGDLLHFSRKAESVFLGRKRLDDTQLYSNSGELVRLKNGTSYVYRIIKIGGTKGSKILNFHTGSRNGFSFALVGNPQIGANGNDDVILWDDSINEIISSLGKVDFIISTGNQVNYTGSIEDVKKNYVDFRSPEVFKEIPIQTTIGNHEAQEVAKKLYKKQFTHPNENEQGNYYFTYQDMLIVGLNSNDQDYVAHRRFLEKAIKSTKRKWVVVSMHHHIFSEGEHSQNDSVNKMRENFSEIFHELNVDLVLTGHDHHHSTPYLMNGIESVDLSKDGKKRYGETLYIAAGLPRKDSYSTRIDVDETGLRISNYRINNGEKIDEYLLMK